MRAVYLDLKVLQDYGETASPILHQLPNVTLVIVNSALVENSFQEVTFSPRPRYWGGMIGLSRVARGPFVTLVSKQSIT